MNRDLVQLRLATWGVTLMGLLALFSIDPNPQWFVVALLLSIGFAWSFFQRNRRNIPVKLLLAASMVFLLWRYLASLVENIQDTRLPLAGMLAWLAAINSFDLPRRHNLKIAQLVGVILMIVTATLSRDLSFGIFLLGFLFVLSWSGHQDHLVELKQKKGQGWLSAVPIALLAALVGFATIPRPEIRFISQLPMSVRQILPLSNDPGIKNLAYPSGGDKGKAFNPKAYYGFSDSLDLGFRGKLDATLALRVKGRKPQYWRGMAYDTFDGQVWRQSRPQADPLTSQGDAFALNPNGNDALLYTFYVEEDQTNLILLPPSPTSLYFPTGQVFRDADEGFRSPVVLEKGLYYTVTASAGNRTNLEKARKSLPIDLKTGKPETRYLQLPPVSDRLRELAKKAVGEETKPYGQLRKLESFLKEAARYDLSIPPYEGKNTVEHFLFEEKRGYCEHFATSMVILARTLGLPCRLVTGYLPGLYNPFTGYFEVKTDQAHSWVEAYFPGHGWVSFDPTPGFLLPQDVGPWPQLARYLQGVPWLLLLLLALAGGYGGWLFFRRPRLMPSSRLFLAFLRSMKLESRPEWTPEDYRRELGETGEDPRVKRFLELYQEDRFGPGVPLGRLQEALKEAKLAKK